MNITIWFGFVLLILLMKFYWPPIKNNNKKKTNGFQLDQPRREGSRLPMHPTDDAPASALGQWVEIQEGGRCSIPTPSTEIQQPVSSYSHSPFPWPHNFGIAALLWKYLHACFFFGQIILALIHWIIDQYFILTAYTPALSLNIISVKSSLPHVLIK